MSPKQAGLEEYNRRRDFSRTAEPTGKAARRRRTNLSFLVQKHAATRLHYDLRLEWDGVLLSWAVTRGPSADPDQKRLAVRTEDHPLSYGSFEGTIPKREYGGGTVMLWDRGQWEPLHDPAEGLLEGKLHFHILGERMKGGWALVRMRSRPGEKRENWLLIKERDGFATPADPDGLTTRFQQSISTGRTMEAIATGESSPVWKKTRRPSAGNDKKQRTLKRPAFSKPQLATLSDGVPAGDDWVHELKYDGYRCLAAIGREGVGFYTRSGLDWSEQFAVLTSAFSGLPCQNALIDGEVLALDATSGSAFSALRRALTTGEPLQFRAFDLLTLDGGNLKAKPLLARKARLEKLLSGHDDPALRYSEHVRGHGDEVLARICGAGGEGIISKRCNAPYRGSRTRSWLKVKCTRRQEFVIGGFSPSTKRGRPFASLLVGDFENGLLIYRGRVGSGFNGRDLQSLAAEMKKLAVARSPFEDVPSEIASVARWVAPSLVAEVDFAEFTDDGHIRHGVFLGLREDKLATTVKLEKAEKNSSPSAKVAGTVITSPDRKVFPKNKITKLDLAHYYATVGERMTAIAAGRPLSLVRCPDGIAGQCFYQKHISHGFPSSLKTVEITESDGGKADYFYLAAAQGLVGAAQMGGIEFHMWGAKVDRLEKPDRLVFDLDPDEAVGFAEVRKAAFDVAERLNGIGLASTAMVTGGKGIHVVVPLRRTVSWETLKVFSKTFATILAEREPDRFVATMSKARRKGKIYIDWLRNERGATAIAPYSVRARHGAPLAMPMSWDELKSAKKANAFSLGDIDSRLQSACPYMKALESPQTLGRQAVSGLEALAG